MSNEPKETRSELIERRIDKTVSADTGISSTGGMAFRNVAQIMEFAKVMALAGVAIPKHLRETPGACMAVCIQAAEWQMSPFAVANKSYSVNDRLAYEAQLVNAVILRRAPIKGRFKIDYSGEGAKRRCKVSATLNDGSGETVEYESPEFEKIPTKNSPLWKGDPDQQLFYYSSRAMCRRHFPDVILGIYTQDELIDAPPEERSANGRVVGKMEVPALEADRVCAGEPPVFPGENPAASLTARAAVERKASLASVTMEQVFIAMVDLTWTDAQTMDDVSPLSWANAEGRFDAIIEEINRSDA